MIIMGRDYYGAPPKTPIFICETLSRALLKKLFEKSFLRIFKNFEQGDYF